MLHTCTTGKIVVICDKLSLRNEGGEKMELTALKIKRLPLETLGIYCMHQMGIDVRKKVSRGTYYKHKNILAQHGYDLRKPVKQEEKDTA